MQLKLDGSDVDALARQIAECVVRELGREQSANGRARQAEQSEPMLLTSKQAAEALQVCERTLHSLTKRGELPAVRAGRALRYDPADIERWIEAAKTSSRDENEQSAGRSGGTER